MVRQPWLNAPVTAYHADLATQVIGTLRTAYASFLTNLTPEDKSGCLKVGVAQLGMMRQIKRICILHPDVMPRYHDLVDYYNRNDTVENLLTIKATVSSLLEAIDGTLVGAQDDGLRMGLDYYYGLKRATKSSMPGLRKHYMEVRDNFIHGTGQTPEDQFPETPETPDAPKTGPDAPTA
jgi:hypothetical protein